MTTLFLATEADEGLGHIAPWYSFVVQALEHNHQVHMAAPPRARSWPELLVSLGYAQPVALAGVVKAWCNILRQVCPAVVMADYAPALMLAARVLDIPVLEVGGGFCVPPLAPQVQNFPGVKPQDPSRLAQADAALTSAFNQCLGAYSNVAAVRCISDLQAWPAYRVVCSPPELDHYGVRDNVTYAGMLKATPSVHHTGPQTTAWPRVVGYLKAGTPGLDSLIDHMVQAEIPALIYISGSASTEPRQLGCVTLTHQAINLPDAFDHAQVYLSNGGLHGVGLALQKGCWPVLVPEQAEQVAMARNLVQHNWGALWMAESSHRPLRPVPALFAPRPRQVRLRVGKSAEEVLLELTGEFV